MGTVVKGGRAFCNGVLKEADVLVHDGSIARVYPRGVLGNPRKAQVVDATGCIVSPGFIDVHFHGCVGEDCCDGSVKALAAMARYEASRGVTAICPATMTYPEEKLNAVMDAVRAFTPAQGESELVGINMEGPFISPNKVGAQNPAYVQPCDTAMLRRLHERSGGLVKIVDVAPEEPGALDFIRQNAGDFRISLAHMCADYECACQAFEAGARQMTHLFNAMPGLHHREPGPIAAAAERDDVTPEIIADGVHVHPAMVRLAFQLFGDERVILISDTMRACGLGDGTFDLGGQDVNVQGGVARLASGTIAGSVTDLAACVQIAVRDMGIPVESALRAATANPARALGIDGQRGDIAPGMVADLVLLDEELSVRDVIVRGDQV